MDDFTRISQSPLAILLVILQEKQLRSQKSIETFGLNLHIGVEIRNLFIILTTDLSEIHILLHSAFQAVRG